MLPHLPFQSESCGLRLVLLYALPPHSLRNFEEVSKVFLTHYASCREAKRNNCHFLTVKMRQEDNLKSYINYFQSKLVKVHNCSEDVSALTVISGLQVFNQCTNIS